MKRARPGWVVLAALLAIAALTIGVRAYQGRSRAAAPGPARTLLGRRLDATAPPGVRIKVEVVNATTVRGLGRRATAHLRDRGFDVVATTTTTRDRRDDVLVLDHSGHGDWAKLVADAMGGGRVETRRDSSRYLDVTVLVGSAWRPPSEPFYP